LIYLIDKQAANRITRRLIGLKTSLGVEITNVSNHAIEMIIGRELSYDTIADTLTRPESAYPGNGKHKEAICYTA
jgi:hypothetical protein